MTRRAITGWKSSTYDQEPIASLTRSADRLVYFAFFTAASRIKSGA